MSKSKLLANRGRVQVFFDESDDVTQQHFASECDVNNIMARYGASRILQHFGQYKGNYGDFTDVQDYQTSMNQIVQAQDMFMSLPSKIRNRFGNDPSQFLDFVSDPLNKDEMRSLGLLKDVVSKEAPEPLKSDENAPV